MAALTAPDRTRPDLPVGLLIGGAWLTGSSAGTLEHVNPATGLVQAEFPSAGASEVDAAVAAARAALPGWRDTDPVIRGRLLRALAEELRRRADEIGRATTLENGTLARYAPAFVEFGAGWFEYYAGWTDKLHGASIPFPGALDYTVREPYGVVGVYLTWNGPTGSMGMKVAAALAAGCTVVVKTPELAPFSPALFGEACGAIGLPPGVVNLLSGGPEAGAILARHPGVDKVSFTGGPEAARSIQIACAETLTPLVLELGGKSATVVFPDADLDRVVADVAAGICTLQGQVCNAPTRLVAHRSIADELVGRIADALGAVRVGDPFDDSSDMGPVISDRAATRIAQMIRQANDSGDGELVVGGERLDRAGYFIRPALFSGTRPDGPLSQNEVFGPVLAATTFEDEDEAVAIANGTRYGLAAYLHTRDLARAHRLAAQLDAGSIGVNGGTGLAGPLGPFGGFKQSGYGKEGGTEGILEYQKTKNVNVRLA